MTWKTPLYLGLIALLAGCTDPAAEQIETMPSDGVTPNEPQRSDAEIYFEGTIPDELCAGDDQSCVGVTGGQPRFEVGQALQFAPRNGTFMLTWEPSSQFTEQLRFTVIPAADCSNQGNDCPLFVGESISVVGQSPLVITVAAFTVPDPALPAEGLQFIAQHVPAAEDPATVYLALPQEVLISGRVQG
jgi:hypothetical protein